MSVSAPSPAVSAALRPPTRLAALAGLGALAAAGLAAWLPLLGLALALGAALLVLLRDVPMPALGRVLVVLAAAAAIMGPNLALPGARAAFAFRVLALLIALGLSAYLLTGGSVRVPAGLGTPLVLAGAWAGWSAVSIGWARSPLAAVRWTALLSLMLALMIGVALVMRTRRGARWVLGVLGVTLALAILVGIAEILIGVRLPTSSLANRVGAFAATSFFGNQNNFATALSLALPFLVALPVVFRDARVRIAGLAGALVAITMILFTGSKANLLAVGLILVALVALLALDRGGRRMLVGALAVVAVAAALIIPSLQGAGPIPLPREAVAKLSFSTLQSQVEGQTGSGAVRSSLVGEGLSLFEGSAGLGVGAGNAESRIRAEAGFLGASNLHNWWLEVLVNLGIVGFGLFVALYLVMLRGQVRIARHAEDPLLRYLGLAGGLALIGFLAASLGPSTMVAFAPMWVTFGVCLGTMVLARGGSSPSGDPLRSSGAGSSPSGDPPRSSGAGSSPSGDPLRSSGAGSSPRSSHAAGPAGASA
jgi:O-antigen ligase